jgi:hypothetical protein
MPERQRKKPSKSRVDFLYAWASEPFAVHIVSSCSDGYTGRRFEHRVLAGRGGSPRLFHTLGPQLREVCTAALFDASTKALLGHEPADHELDVAL